ncbi:hypothetical protein AMTRI_Chr01g136520 [Amborella trichopoda]
MSWVFSESKRSLISSFIPPSPPPQPEVFNGFLHQNQLNPSPYNFQNETSTNKISPDVLFIIIILAVVFFISGLLHLLVRFLLRPQSPSPREPELSDSANTFQGQLQQLFNLHDSGVDQAFIDALPIFIYKAIMGSETEPPFDCSVCLCEQSPHLIVQCAYASSGAKISFASSGAKISFYCSEIVAMLSISIASRHGYCLALHAHFVGGASPLISMEFLFILSGTKLGFL